MSDIEAPATQDQPVSPDVAPETDQPTGGEGLSLDNFDPSQVPEEYRQHVEAAYKQLQGDYTRKTQGLAAERQEIEQNALAQWAQAVQSNPSLLKQLDLDERRLIEEFGYAPAEDEEDDYIDPTERELQEIKQWKSQIEQQEHETAQYEAAADFVEGELEKLEQQTGQAYDDEEAQWIFDFATARPTKNGAPDVKGAIQALDAVGKKRVEAFKEAARAPRKPGQGRSGSKAVDLTNKEARELAMAEAAQDVIASRDSA